MSRSLGALAVAAVRSLTGALRGQGALSGVDRRDFARGLLSSLRPHFFALPAGAALAGAASGEPESQPLRVALATLAAALGWGVGQLINDLMDRAADAVDAPERASVKGLLPDGPTLLVALLLGAGVASATLAVHPRAVWLACAAAVLLLSYDALKPFPLAGNLVHGTLIAVAALIGAAAARPAEPLAAALAHGWPVAVIAGGWAAVYLEANYEKDCLGDAHAGYRTLPMLIGLRASATLRAVAGTGLVAAALIGGAVASSWVGHGALALAGALLLGSAGWVALKADQPAALASYRLAVHAAALGMLALGSRALGDAGTLGAVLTSRTLDRACVPHPKKSVTWPKVSIVLNIPANRTAPRRAGRNARGTRESDRARR